MRALARIARLGIATLALATAGAAAADESGAASADVIIERAAETLLGSSIGALPVVATDGSPIGDVSDVILSTEGRVIALVVGVGGLLGVGEKPVAIRWDRLSVRSTDEGFEIVSGLDRAALEAAPRYRERED